MKIFRVCGLFYFDYLSEILVIRTETCLCGQGNRGTGSLTGVDSKLGRRTCKIAKRCAPSSVERPMLKSKGAGRVFGSSHIFYIKYIGGIEYSSCTFVKELVLLNTRLYLNI